MSIMSNTLWVPQGIAQLNQNYPKNTTKKSVEYKKPTKPPDIYYPTYMKDPISIPNVPVYPGKPEFKGGQATLNNRVSQTYIMSYKAKERPSVIMKFYKSALSPPLWKINTSTSEMISATDSSGARVCVQVNQQPKGSSYTIYYNTALKSN